MGTVTTGVGTTTGTTAIIGTTIGTTIITGTIAGITVIIGTIVAGAGADDIAINDTLTFQSPSHRLGLFYRAGSTTPAG